ncbi:MAG: hypothetical protein WCO52_03195 [bacterium]
MKRSLIVALFVCAWTSMVQAAPVSDQLRQIGVGIWIGQPSKCGTPAEMVNQAKAAGIGHVYLKVHDGIQLYVEADRVPEIARAMQSAGIKVFVWGFNHANHPHEEAHLICDWLSRDYVDGYVYNTETPMESKPKWGETEQLVSEVSDYRTTKCPQKLLGFAPYAIPSKHRALPYQVLVGGTDFIEPQMYWRTMGRSVKETVNWTYREWKAWEHENGIKKPIVPLGQTYGLSEASEVLEFGKRTRGYNAVSYWTWQQTNDLVWKKIGMVSQGRSREWSDVGYTGQPSVTLTNVPNVVIRVWLNILSNYLLGLSVILFIGMTAVAVEGSATPNRRRWWAALAVLVGLSWPVLLALLAAALVLFVGYWLVRLATYRKKSG